MILFNTKTILWPIKSAKILAFSSFIFIAGAGHAQNQVIQLPKKSITIQEVFKQIEKQTKLSVDYNNKKVSNVIREKVNISDGNIQDVLREPDSLSVLNPTTSLSIPKKRHLQLPVNLKK